MKKILFIITVTFSVIFMFQVVYCNENTDEILKQKYDSLAKFNNNDIVYGFRSTEDDAENSLPDVMYYKEWHKYYAQERYDYGNGVLGGYIGDIDNDNDSELIVFCINCGSKGVYCDREKTNAIDIDIYEVKDGEAYKSDTIRGMEQVLIAGKGGVECFIKTVDNKKYICIQNNDDLYYTNEIYPLGYDIARINITIFSYDGNNLNTEVNNKLIFESKFKYNHNNSYNKIFYNDKNFSDGVYVDSHTYSVGAKNKDRFLYKDEDLEKFNRLGFYNTYNYIKNKYEMTLDYFNIAEMEDNVCKVYEMLISNNILEVKKNINNENSYSDNLIKNAKVRVKKKNYTHFYNKNDLKIYYKGKPIEFYNKPKVIDGKIMVPLKELFKYLNCEIGYNSENKSLNLKLKNEYKKYIVHFYYNAEEKEEYKKNENKDTIIIYNGFNKITVNGFGYDLTDGPRIIDNIYWISLNDIEDIMNVLDSKSILINNDNTIYLKNEYTFEY